MKIGSSQATAPARELRETAPRLRRYKNVTTRHAPSELRAATLPRAVEGDPNGKENQSEIEPEALPPYIEEVVPELLPARDVAVGVDLGQPRQPRGHPVALLVAEDPLDRHDLAPAVDLDLLRPESPRTDEAHVASEDAPELGQLVHGRRPEPPPHRCDPRVGVARLERAEPPVGVRDHRPELQALEAPAVLAHPLLEVEEAAPIIQLDEQRDQRPDRRRVHEGHSRKEKIEDPLGPPRARRQGTRSNRRAVVAPPERRADPRLQRLQQVALIASEAVGYPEHHDLA